MTIDYFKSYKPRRYITINRYIKLYNRPDYMMHIRYGNHLSREVCILCKKPFGEHYGESSNPTCKKQ